MPSHTSSASRFQVSGDSDEYIFHLQITGLNCKLNGSFSKRDNTQPSYMLQRYLQAKPAVFQDHYETLSADPNRKKNNNRSKEAAKNIEAFEKTWKGGEGCR